MILATASPMRFESTRGNGPGEGPGDRCGNPPGGFPDAGPRQRPNVAESNQGQIGSVLEPRILVIKIWCHFRTERDSINVWSRPVPEFIRPEQTCPALAPIVKANTSGGIRSQKLCVLIDAGQQNPELDPFFG